MSRWFSHFLPTALGVTAGVLTGCASGVAKSERSTVQTVQSAKASVDRTNEYIQRAEETLKTFEQSLANLRREAQASPELRGRDRFLLSLGTFDGRLAEARHELQQLKLANAESWEAYQRRVQSAEGVLKEEFRSRVGTAPRSVRRPSEEAAAAESDE
jgi:phage-related tail protein